MNHKLQISVLVCTALFAISAAAQDTCTLSGTTKMYYKGDLRAEGSGAAYKIAPSDIADFDRIVRKLVINEVSKVQEQDRKNCKDTTDLKTCAHTIEYESHKDCNGRIEQVNGIVAYGITLQGGNRVARKAAQAMNELTAIQKCKAAKGRKTAWGPQ